MTKEEFLALAEEQWDTIAELQGEKSFYEYEKKFEKVWLNYGCEAFEKSISNVGKDRRTKKNLKVDSEK